MRPSLSAPVAAPPGATPPSSHTEDRAPSSTWRTWLLIPVGVFLVARLVSSLLLVTLGEGHPGLPGETVVQFQAPTTPLNLHTNWDAQWYQLIVEQGYPSELPRNDAGDVLQNPWAFFPLFPALVAVLAETGLSFAVAAMLVSLSSGAVAMVLLFRLLATTCTNFTAGLTVTALSFSPAALAFGIPYTESLGLALILLCLTFLGQRRPTAFIVTALALSLARPVAPALAAVVGVVWLVRWFNRRSEPFPVRERFMWAGIAVLTAMLFLLWPAVVGIATGEWNAYALTQKSWHPGVTGWDSWLASALSGDPTLLITALLLAGAVAVGLRYGRRWPVALRAWTVLYPLFILGASRPTPSIVRYLTLTAAPAWPLPDMSNRVTSPLARSALVVMVVTVGTGLQILWIDAIWLSTAGLFP